ncbi:MAG: methyltransferase domain-containing protein [Phycisphaera sp.]|nr:MAG: methyltransferase domain-containing protein [Phycisphaera sp.]
MDPTVSYRKLDPRVQAALIERAALGCARKGHRKIAVFGAGQHTRRHGLKPFRAGGLEVVAILDDHAKGEIEGVGIHQPESFAGECDAVIVSSDGSEDVLFAGASAWAMSRGCEALRVYTLPDTPVKPRVKTTSEHELKRLREMFTGKLNLGCGEDPLPGWTNIDGGDGQWYEAPKADDVIRLDVFDALAHIEDASCDAVFSEHFFEHFSLEDGHRLITEWARVLKPGGLVRVVTPNLEREAMLYLHQFEPAPSDVIDAHRMRWLADRYEKQPGEALTRAMVLNFGMRLDGHQFVYDFETLRQSLSLAGFGGITQAEFGTSEHGPLDGLDRHDGGETGRSWVPRMVLAVDAVKKQA